jgi:hypothetical protein
MKKLIISSLIALLFCSPFISLSLTNKSYKAILSKKEDPFKSKTFSKSFPVAQNDKIDLYNKYGSLTIKVWDKKEIKLDAEIKAYGLTETEAQALLDSIYIDAAKTTNQISFKTTISSKNKSWGEGYINGMKFHKEAKINMIVYMPGSNALTLNNSFGNVVMGDFNGSTLLKIQHGDLIGGNLNNAENNISVQFGKIDLKDVNMAKIENQHGKGLTINNINSLNLDAQYSVVNIGIIKNKAVIKQQHGNGLTIKEVGNLDLTAQYSAVDIDNIKNTATIKQQHGNGLTIKGVENLNLTAQYVNVTLSKVNGNANADLQHGNLKISEVTTSCKNLKIDANYTNVKVGFNNNYSANFNLSTNYGDFDYGTNIDAKNLNDDKGSYKKYTGKIGNGSTTSLVNIEAQHGNINLN